MAVEVTGARNERFDEILTERALGLIEQLHREYDGRRRELLERRKERVAEIAAGGVAGVLAGDQGRAGRPGLAGRRRRRRDWSTAGSRSPGRPTGR